jgi:hypothetical protein
METLEVNAEGLLESAVKIAASSSERFHWTILRGANDQLILLSGSYVPLESLRLQLQAHEAFRIVAAPDQVRIEARASGRCIALSSPTPPSLQPHRLHDQILYERL